MEEGYIPVKSTGQYPLPSEGVRFIEPEWKLHGLIKDPECEERFERRMEADEEMKVLVQEQTEASQGSQDETEKSEIRQEKLQEQQSEEAMSAQEKAERAEAKRAFAEEIERAVREIRVEANEQHLRAAEAQIATMHCRAERREKVLEEDEEQAEQDYMDSVQRQREMALEAEEERRFDTQLDRLDFEERLQRMTEEGEDEERQHIDRQERRSNLQQELHVFSNESNELELEEMARKNEEDAREQDELDDSTDGHGDSKVVLQLILDEAKTKHESFKGELRERHLSFVDTLRRKAEDLNRAAEAKRKEEWAAGDKSLAESTELLRRARWLVDNMDVHVKQLNDEYRAIAERQDLWPIRTSRKPQSAGAVDHRRSRASHKQLEPGSDSGPVAARPMTSPGRRGAIGGATGGVEAVGVEGARGAPTGFGHAVRIVFEHLDRKREGRVREAEAAEGLRLLGLAEGVSLAGLFGGVAGVEGIEFDEFQTMVLGVLGRQHSPTKTPPPPLHSQQPPAGERRG